MSISNLRLRLIQRQSRPNLTKLSPILQTIHASGKGIKNLLPLKKSKNTNP